MNAPMKPPVVLRLTPLILFVQGLIGAAVGACTGLWVAIRALEMDRTLALRVISDRSLRGAIGVVVAMLVSGRVSGRPHTWYLGGMFGMMMTIGIVEGGPTFDPARIPLILRIAHAALMATMGGCIAGVIDRWFKVTTDPRSAKSPEGGPAIDELHPG